MLDFAVNDKGDLITSSTTSDAIFKLMFYIGETDGLLVKFDTDVAQAVQSHNGICVNFTTLNYDQLRTCYKVDVATDDKLLEQMIKLRLKTELGEIAAKKTLGSELVLARHKSITKELLQSIAAKALAAIKDILPNAEVIAAFERGEGSFYYANVNIYIYNDNTLVLKYGFEV